MKRSIAALFALTPQFVHAHEGGGAHFHPHPDPLSLALGIAALAIGAILFVRSF